MAGSIANHTPGWKRLITQPGNRRLAMNDSADRVAGPNIHHVVAFSVSWLSKIL